jgi:hypothetical protein
MSRWRSADGRRSFLHDAAIWWATNSS